MHCLGSTNLKPNVKDLADGHSTKIVMKLVFFSSDRNTSFYIWLESRLILKLDLLRKCVQNKNSKLWSFLANY